jgi:hypothetical protein
VPEGSGSLNVPLFGLQAPSSRETLFCSQRVPLGQTHKPGFSPKQIPNPTRLDLSTRPLAAVIVVASLAKFLVLVTPSLHLDRRRFARCPSSSQPASQLAALHGLDVCSHP